MTDRSISPAKLMAADLARLWPPFREKVLGLLADPDARRLGVYAVSGFRSVELQAALYADALTRYGSEREARRWVAPPGKSKHGPRVNVDGREPGPYGSAVDLGVAGYRAAAGKWPKKINDQVAALADRYEMFSPLEWEDWHHEPKASLFTRAHNIPAPNEVDDVAKLTSWIVLDPKGPDDVGRDSHWEIDDQGNVYNWNGARPIRSLRQVDPGAKLPLVDVVPDPSGDGFVCFAADQMLEPNGHWTRSTYKLTVGM